MSDEGERAGEEELVAWLRDRTGADIGDDCAFLPTVSERDGGSWAVTVDAQIEGVHVQPETGEDVLARRLLAVNLSDLAAVGAKPVHAFLALAAPKTFDHRRYLEALIAVGEEIGLSLSGGDLAGGDRYHATLTLLGHPHNPNLWLRRDAAHPGDRLYLGGPVGLSALGLRLLDRNDDPPERLKRIVEECRRRHLEPLEHVVEQLDLGRRLAESGHRIAALDVSDGVTKDLRRMCRASGVGAVLQAEAFEPEKDVAALATRLGVEARRLALEGGEDYVLLFAMPDGETPPADCREVGRVVKEERLWIEKDGERQELDVGGWDHLAK